MTTPPASAAEEAPIAIAPPGVDVHALASAPLGGRIETKEPRPNRGLARHEPARPAATAPPAEPTTDTADELQLLERAQTAASRARGSEALTLVALHRRDFPQGRFMVEMSVVEIEALAQSGLVERAAERGKQFLESHPGSPYARRVEAIVRSGAQMEKAR